MRVIWENINPAQSATEYWVGVARITKKSRVSAIEQQIKRLRHIIALIAKRGSQIIPYLELVSIPKSHIWSYCPT
ncbi:MAG: hypothetical protein ABI955_11565 [Nitrospirota bacterium]